MALVSSSPAPAPLCSPASPLFAPEQAQAVRILPSTPHSSASMNSPSTQSYPRKTSTSSNAQGQAMGGTQPGLGSAGGALRGASPVGAAGTVRPLPSPQPPRARTASAPHGEPLVSPGAPYAVGRTGVANSSSPSTPLPPPSCAPSRSSSTPPTSATVASRPAPSPTPGARSTSSSSVHSSRSASYHAHSASYSSSASAPAVPALPRLPTAHLSVNAQSPNHGPQPLPFYPQQPPPQHPGAMPGIAAHPSFVNQPFPPPFAQAWPQPAFPFMPSPHPNGPNGPFPFATNGATPGATPGSYASAPPTAEAQKRLQHYQQQWQMEMMKNQQAVAAAQTGGDWRGDGQRRRATSGPAPNHASPKSYYALPLPYPPSPASPGTVLQAYPLGATLPTLPPGAMLPHFGGHGYPTPPGSVEGASRSGGESGSSSGGSARAEGGYHPYRRNDTGRSSSAHGHRANPSSSSAVSSGLPARAGTPKHQHAPPSQQHSRSESTASVPALAPHNFPALPSPISAASSPVAKSATASGRTPPASRSAASSASSSPVPPSFPRSRTTSQNSSSSASHAPPPSALSQRQRGESFESGRSSTPVQVQARVRPSPLSATQESEDDEDTGAESDGTAEATATISTGMVAAPAVATVMEHGNGKGKAKEVAAPVSAPPRSQVQPQLQEKEKKGMKSRFKKAFGGSSNASNGSELQVDGRGPKQLNGGYRPRRDSSSSSGTSDAPHTPPSVPYATHQSLPSMASINSTATLGNDAASTATGRKPPSSRFRLLNSKLNSSTDNISISSTVSSASVMIRKLGQMGKLARRNSLMGLTKAFKKDKNKDDGAESTLEGGEGSSGGGKLSKKDKKKSVAITGSVSHATAEYDTSSYNAGSLPTGISPAAALAKKQQMAYAEQEAAEAKAAAEEAARLGPPQRSFEQVPSGHGGHSRTDSDASSMKSGRGKLFEKEKDKGKSKKWRLGFGGSKTDLAETSSINDDAASTYTANTERAGTAMGYQQNGDGDSALSPDLEVLAPPGALGYQTYRADGGQDSEGEYEPSLYRQGATPHLRAKAVKGILKGAGTYRQDDYAAQAPFNRNRASSFDAPQQQARPGSPNGATLVNVIPSEQQVDGVAPSATSPRSDTHPPSSAEVIHDAAISRVHPNSTLTSHPGGGPYANPGLNASAPVLNHFASQPSIRSASAPGATGRRINFAANLSVHTTWPAAIYDRRAEPATCNRLTPALAQSIKEELNSFKMEEMNVHPMSRKLTHFFV
ncbi:hypothetical protein JCM11641_006768 [Rhodosporidiobolus odoratus]